MSNQAKQQPMKRADSSEGSTVGFGSPISTKLSWADLHDDDGDSNEWEGEFQSFTEQRKEQTSSAKGNVGPLRGSNQETVSSKRGPQAERRASGGRMSKRGGRSGQQQQQQQQQRQQHQQHQQQTPQQQAQQRHSPKGGWSSTGHTKGARRSSNVVSKPPFPMLGFTMPPQGFSPMDSYSVVVEGMPINLCNDVCLEAMLHQAGLQGAIANCDIVRASTGGAATIKFNHWQPAVQCYNHFTASRWSSGALKVSMRLPDNSLYTPGSWPKEGEDTSTRTSTNEAPLQQSKELPQQQRPLQQPQQCQQPSRDRSGSWPKSPFQFSAAQNVLAGYATDAMYGSCYEDCSEQVGSLGYTAGFVLVACSTEGPQMSGAMVWQPRVSCS